MEFQKSSFPDRAKFWICLLALAVSFTSLNVCAQSTNVCDPAPAVNAALDQLPQYRQDPARTDWQVYKQRLAVLHSLLRQYPNDVFVQQAYIRSAATPHQVDQVSGDQRRKVIAEYKARHEQNPDSAQMDYLYGLTLVDRDTPEAIKLFDTALEKDASFALPHLELASIYRSSAFLNSDGRTTHLKNFLAACPSSLTGCQRVAGLGNKDLLRKYAASLRVLLQNRTDADAMKGYQTLWSLEFQARPPSE